MWQYVVHVASESAACDTHLYVPVSSGVTLCRVSVDVGLTPEKSSDISAIGKGFLFWNLDTNINIYQKSKENINIIIPLYGNNFIR